MEKPNGAIERTTDTCDNCGKNQKCSNWNYHTRAEYVLYHYNGQRLCKVCAKRWRVI